MKFKYLLASISAFFLFTIAVDAASFNVNSSAKEVKPNGTFTVSVSGDCIGRVDITVVNGTISKSSVWVEQNYQTISVKAGSSGSVKVIATPAVGFSDADANIYNPKAKSVTVNVKKQESISNSGQTQKPSSKSSNNKLSSLEVEQGRLTPTFDSEKQEYTINLSANITSINIKAKASHNKAKVSGTGKVTVKAGENKINITVTAEDGSKKIYKIKAYVEESPQVYFDFEGQQVGVQEKLEIALPTGFQKKEIRIDDKVIEIAKSEQIALIYGVNENKEKDFYLFDENKKEITNKIVTIENNGQNYYVVENYLVDEKTKEVKINDKTVKGYEISSLTDNYYLLNLLNSNGEIDNYLYEAQDEVIMAYPSFKCEEKEIIKDNKNLVYGLGGIDFLLVEFSL
ncbi:MAG: cadherin-like beta sandwich domain-containing protein [Bacilli bacterium]|nr:cadherin-like beta sandwich domain-containing protein [Bacilli bacterium]